MITDKDIVKLKQVFATKDDLKAMEQRQDAKYATKDDLSNEFVTIKKDLKQVKKDVRYIKKTAELTLRYIDEENKTTRKRLDKVELHLGLSAPLA